MASNPEVWSLLTGCVGLFLVLLDSTPAARSIVRRFVRAAAPTQQDGSRLTKSHYSDEDGEATETSLRDFSDKWHRVAIGLLSVAGLEISLGLATITTVHAGIEDYIVQSWLQVGVWACLCFQAVAFFIEPSPTERYIQGQFAFGASVLTFLVPCIEIIVGGPVGKRQSMNQASIGLVVTQIAIAFSRGVCCLLIPRRPDVFYNGQIVDQQYTVSVLCRFTFSWVDGILRGATQNKGLDIDDLPALPSSARPETLHTRFEETRTGKPLWKALIVAHRQPLVLQSTLALVSCALSFGPQLALYGILNCLEKRGSDSWDASESWIWVSAMACFMLLSSSVDSWLFWIIYSRIGVPIYEELAAMVFAKSMRRKDVKDMKMSNHSDGATLHSSMSSIADAEEDNEHAQQSLQSIINYAAVDSKRVADFASYSYLIPHALLRLLIACGILLGILGWMSLLAGLLVGAVVGPVNGHLAQKYAKSQDDLMKLRDQRTDVVSEALQGIRQIKFSALEGEWEKKIAERRHSELESLWTSFLYSTGLISIWILGPLMLSAVSLAVYTLINGGITAPVAFTAMAIFGSLELSMASLPGLMSRLLEAKVSSDRIDKYMACPEKPVNTIPSEYISFEAASVAWPAGDHSAWEDGERFTLSNLNLSFPSKGLSVISGKTGSGKSLLLASILGECDVLNGKVKVPPSPQLNAKYDRRLSSAEWIIDNAIAYVAQIPWIEIGTIRDNVLFGLPYHPARYRKVLFASGLDKDLDMLPEKEMTDIGANGVNLSGGQRWRVSFARALYSRAGILIMDDIFSALDAHTGRHVYDNALTGELGQNRTRILVTHHASLCLPRTDYSVLLDNGTVKHAGTVEELQRNDSLSDLLLLEETVRAENQHPVKSPNEPNTQLKTAVNKGRIGTRKRTSNTSKRSSLTSRRSSINSKRSRRSSAWSGSAMMTMSQSDPRKFVNEEKSGSGSVSLSVCVEYIKKGGSMSFWALVFGAYISYTCLILGRSWWVQLWTSSSNPEAYHEHHSLDVNNVISRLAAVKADDDLFMYLSVYVGVSVLACVVGTAKYFALMTVGLEASKNLFNDLTYAVLRAPLGWLDTVPLGRILNRFTTDIYMVDVRLGYDIGLFTEKVLEISGIMVAGMVVSPFVIIFAIIVLVVCLKLSLTYLAGAREAKRLESTARSPIFEHFDSSLAGLATIRAFNKVETYIGTMYSKISVHARAAWNLWLFNMWLDYRMSIVGAFFSTITAALVVYFPSIPASLAGFGLSFALKYNNAIVMVLRQYAGVELDMNATERVIEYSKIETESQDGMDAPASWPTEGRVEVDDLVVGYAPDLPPVLDGLSFTMEKNQRVGVVGRSGAGKSSLALALFRFLEARQGHIYIDGLDVSKIKLYDLRSRLAIIPQDPVLFSGTVRSNLDPFDEHSDAELHDAMERVNLVSFGDTDTLASDSSAQPPIKRTWTPISTAETLASSHTSHSHVKDNHLFSTLSSMISEGGLNLSQGQRQLLCLARAILSRPKVMILDEATSAVDMETDALIQRSIRAEFGRNASTLLVIAHRLSTIADFDRILVIDAGKAVEFGSPRDLMEIEGGMFKSLVENSGERDVLEQAILGKGT